MISAFRGSWKLRKSVWMTSHRREQAWIEARNKLGEQVTGGTSMRNAVTPIWSENRQALPCPHCGSGADESTVGLYWSNQEHCWQCVICGYRKFKQRPEPKGKAEIAAERMWEEILNALDEEENNQTTRPE